MDHGPRSASCIPVLTGVARVELPCGAFDVVCADHAVRGFPPRFHDTFAIGVIESGLLRLRTDRGEWNGGVGTVLAIAPGEVHSAESLTPEGWRYRMIYPDLRTMHAIGLFLETRDHESPRFAAPVISDPALGAALSRTHQLLMDATWDVIAEARLTAALSRLVRDHGGCDRDFCTPHRPVELRAVERARAYLEARCTEPTRLSAVAEECGMSIFHLIRVFGKIVGVPPYAYLIQLRVNRAKAMLRQGIKVSDVAYSCGFSDQSHLTRAFRKAVGVPPGQFLRSVRPKAA